VDAAERRVRRLQLRAGDAQLVRRGAILVEDALRTMTVPGGEGPRVLLIRKLALGRIPSGAPPSTVALRFGEQLRMLAARAVRADEPHAAAPAVWFADEVEPLIALARRVALGLPAQAWFWRAAVAGYAPTMPARRFWQLVIEGALRTRAGTHAVVALAETLVEARALDRLAAVLEPVDGESLLRAFGWSRPAPGAPVEPLAREAEPLAPGWEEALAPFARRLGADDARVVWLTAVALAAVRPPRLLDRRLAARARRVSERLVRAAPSTEPAPARANDQPAPSPSDTPPRSAAVEPPAPAKPIAPPPPVEPRAPAPAPSAPDPSAPVVPRAPAPVVLDAPAPPIAPTPVEPRAAAPVEPRARFHLPSRRRPPLVLGEPADTEWAGLYFLLPLLMRLGLPSLLAAQPELLELDLPHRVLRRLARRLAIPDDDPILAPLVEPPRRAGYAPFVVPRAWWPLAAAPLAMSRAPEAPGVRLLADARGLPLALWMGRAPDGARALAAASSVRRAPPAPLDEPDVAAWCAAAERWLERHAELTLEQLVRRRGRVCLTRTHLDLLFALDDTDLRVRQAGLDFNPGWLPWFGRVVVFHYLDDGEGP